MSNNPFFLLFNCSRLFSVSILLATLSYSSYTNALETESTTCFNRQTRVTKHIDIEFINSRTKLCQTLYGFGENRKEIAWGLKNSDKCKEVANRLISQLENTGYACTSNQPKNELSAPSAVPTPVVVDMDLGNQSSKQRDEIVRLAKGNWKSECIFNYPEGWESIVELGNGPGLLIFPGSDHIFSEYKFNFSAIQHQYTPEEFFLIYNQQLSLEATRKLGLSKTTYDRLKALSQKISKNRFISLSELVEPQDLPPNRTVVGQVELSHMLTDGDGTKIEKNNVNITRDIEFIDISSLYVPFVSHSQDLTIKSNGKISENVMSTTGIEFSCKADKSMNQDIFSQLCKMLIEKTTKNKDHSSMCRVSDDQQELVKAE
jgi:hypothetical protein